MGSVRFQNAAWIVAWDQAAGRHVYLRDADLVIENDRIAYIGRMAPQTAPHLAPRKADEVIDGSGLMVIPGLIDIHSHPSTEPFFRGIREEHGLPAMFMSGLYERGFAFRPDAPGRSPGRPSPMRKCC